MLNVLSIDILLQAILEGIPKYIYVDNQKHVEILKRKYEEGNKKD